MQFKSKLLVLGAKSSKGDYNGTPYDKTVVFFQADTQEGENFCGQVGESMVWGKSENFQKIKDLSFPLHCDVVLNQVSNGKTLSTVIVDLQPIKKLA